MFGGACDNAPRNKVVDPVLTGVCLSRLSACVHRCVRGFGGNGRETSGPREIGFRCNGDHTILGLGTMASERRHGSVIGRVGRFSGRETGVPYNISVSTGFEHLGCMQCTSSFLYTIVKAGGRTRTVGRSVGGFLTRGLSLRLSSRGALVARKEGSTGFLNCRVCVHGSMLAGEGGTNELAEPFGGGICLGVPARIVEGGLLSCNTLRVGVRGKGRFCGPGRQPCLVGDSSLRVLRECGTRVENVCGFCSVTGGYRSLRAFGCVVRCDVCGACTSGCEDSMIRVYGGCGGSKIFAMDCGGEGKRALGERFCRSKFGHGGRRCKSYCSELPIRCFCRKADLVSELGTGHYRLYKGRGMGLSVRRIEGLGSLRKGRS